MSLKMINSENAPEALGPYSHAVVAGDYAFISGQIPINPTTNNIVEGGIEAQTKQSLENCVSILKSCGATLKDVVKAGIFISDMNNFGAINEIYSQYFTEHKPARACVEVARLPKDVMVEIEMIAYIGK